MAYDNEQYLHREWLGLLQPEGLVVSPPALVDKQAFVDKGSALRLQPVLQGLVKQELLQGKEQSYVPEFLPFAEQVLEWDGDDVVAEADLPASLEVNLSDYGEVLRPQYGVIDQDSDGYLLLVKVLPSGRDLDGEDPNAGSGGWKASPQQKFERLLKGVNVPIGILWNGVVLRLVYAPSGESSGHITFPIEAMTEVPGRLILGALEMLLGGQRLFNVAPDRTLPKLLEASRDYQANVSTKLAEQVLDALWELLRAFQAAEAQRDDRRDDRQYDNQTAGLKALAKLNPQHVYGGLLTAQMRLVFLLYAEDKGLLPNKEAKGIDPNNDIYDSYYSVSGLYEKLRDDSSCYPDTMDQRYGAWAWLLSLFRLVYDGGGATEDYLPARHGQLFDPDEYPFLEGRSEGTSFVQCDSLEVPRVSDGAIYRILNSLLILDGERLSYRTLEVQDIGSVYEAIMGYEVEIAQAQSIAVRPKDVVIDLEALLKAKAKDRAKFLKEEGELKLSGKAATALKQAETVPDLLAALERRVSGRTTQVLMPGALYLQPGEERRRTGSHYTPRKLTQPIVETTLRPIFERLGDHPTAEQILELKVCDLAMGSAAFLVEVCLQLAEKLVEAWTFHKMLDDVPDEVEPLLYARRLVAQRCLYGVDKNPFAVNLAKLSLWLVTLARDLPFTFVDHSLKCGDSLVGLTRQEIFGFGQKSIQNLPLIKLEQEQLLRASRIRVQIQSSDTKSDADAALKVHQFQEAEAKLSQVRIKGDVAISAFFDSCGRSKKERESILFEYEALVRQQKSDQIIEISERLKNREKPVVPFNWEIEFPEVFDRENGGFDAIVGNPPFIGGKKMKAVAGENYQSWLLESYPESTKNGDLVAFFFRRAFLLLRNSGSFGLIATNTIAQGDTRTTGLRFLCVNDGTIYDAQKRLKWPGLAAVVVSVINVVRGPYKGSKRLNDQRLDSITAFLFHAGGHENPSRLIENSNKSFVGSYMLGMGFTFDDTNDEATSIAEMNSLIKKNPKNREKIFPYIGGAEVNASPTHAHHRYAINFFDLSEEQAKEWPDLMAVVEEKVKPERTRTNTKGEFVLRSPLPQRWWQYADKRPALVRAIATCDRVLVIPEVTAQFGFAFLPANSVFAHTLKIIATESFSTYSCLQSRFHEIWARFFGSSLEDRLRYTPSDCFETFPFPENWETDPTLKTIGQTYYQFRADLMVRNNQGLTDTYNRFHDPQETDPEILKLRHLHAQMDQAVLNAYGWTQDLETNDQGLIPCGFALDYLDIDETNLPPETQDRIATGNLYWADPAQAAAFDNQIQASQKRRKKLPWRYRWPEATHDEILARLLDLNQTRYDEEVRGGLHGKKKTGKGKAKAKKTAKAKTPTRKKQLDLIPPATEQLDLL